MPAFNSARTLRDSVVSVLDQTFPSLELVVVDDASTDATAAILRDLQDRDQRVRVVRRPSGGGPAEARNTGIAVARGRFLAFCDADDLWLPDKLRLQLDLMAETGASLSYSAYHRIPASFAGSATAFTPEERIVTVPREITYQQLLHRNLIGCLTAVVDTSRTGSVRMPDVPGAEDWALWLRILREGGRAAGLLEPTALYRTAQTGSHSAQRIRAARAVWRVLRQEERLPIVRAFRYLVTDAVAALRKSRI